MQKAVILANTVEISACITLVQNVLPQRSCHFNQVIFRVMFSVTNHQGQLYDLSDYNLLA